MDTPFLVRRQEVEAFSGLPLVTPHHLSPRRVSIGGRYTSRLSPKFAHHW
ncbi:hypothetical protein KCP69_16980 [Salmonella enterica subsp. enterica]|nr:hypothetical protein KCP69_16980 [Salmonella enterica subsp. enterica]